MITKADRESAVRWLQTLGNLPRGFYQADGGFDCDDTSPAFVRGILLPTSTYDAMSIDQRLLLNNPDVYPRYRLYGGPFQQRAEADSWDRYLNFYAFSNGQTWVSHGTVCIVPGYALAWPADSGMRWDWVWEAQRPPEAQKQYDAQRGQNVIVWV